MVIFPPQLLKINLVSALNLLVGFGGWILHQKIQLLNVLSSMEVVENFPKELSSRCVCMSSFGPLCAPTPLARLPLHSCNPGLCDGVGPTKAATPLPP
jgi:hypothetical protein